MKVLHIWDTAGTASIIAKYMDMVFGTESLVVHTKTFDLFGLTTYGELWDCGANTFSLRCLLLARKFDVVHIHTFDKLIPFLKVIYPKKPVVLHYHGSEIRGNWLLKRRFWSKADVILYSTTELLSNETPKTAVYMPNPVDTNLFYPLKARFKPKTAFHISYNADDLAKMYANKYHLELTIHNRERQRIPHFKLSEILRQYEYYIDIKKEIITVACLRH
jgi:glycosyltransferase involved in cell wall biosynthesis